MTNKERINNIPDAAFVSIASRCESKMHLHRLLRIPYNGTGGRILEDKLKKTKAKLKLKKLKYETIGKVCPVCFNKFLTKKGHKREKIVCSHSCANTFFRSGEDNGNWKESNYRTTCFLYHKKKCIICGEELIVAVHHFDNDKSNNSPENLMPLCPTHHQYIHSKYAPIVEDKIISYRDKFILAEEEKNK